MRLLRDRAHFRRRFADPGRQPGATACLTSSMSSPRKASPVSTPTAPVRGARTSASTTALALRRSVPPPSATACRASSPRPVTPGTASKTRAAAASDPAVCHRAPGMRALPGVARGLGRRRRPEPRSAARPGNARGCLWRCRPMLNAGTDTTPGGVVQSWPSGGRALGGRGENCSAELTVTGSGPFGLGSGLSLPAISRRTSHRMVGTADRAISLNRFALAAVLPMGKKQFVEDRRSCCGAETVPYFVTIAGAFYGCDSRRQRTRPV